jgi:hypothetical protein
MRKLKTQLPTQITMLTAVALALTVSLSAARAQIQTRGAADLNAQLQNATPLVRDAACRGFGPFCPPGSTRRCGPYRCWCVRCY